MSAFNTRGTITSDGAAFYLNSIDQATDIISDFRAALERCQTQPFSVLAAEP